jgi:Transposase IS200 like
MKAWRSMMRVEGDSRARSLTSAGSSARVSLPLSQMRSVTPLASPWVTKYRYPVLGGDVGIRCRELLRETARAHEMVVLAGSINRDRVHMLLSIPPSLSVSRCATPEGSQFAQASERVRHAAQLISEASICGRGAIGW